ncbi:MAG: hypothetical protein DME26_19390 [Verrucomicrobia bacterium]|nr:MAG: hypothetical protein DME26_19390 [Verrucomicrobiota bacterium]
MDVDAILADLKAERKRLEAERERLDRAIQLPPAPSAPVSPAGGGTPQAPTAARPAAETERRVRGSAARCQATNWRCDGEVYGLPAGAGI